MLSIIDVRGQPASLSELLPKPGTPGGEVSESVAAIISEVRTGGDAAVRRLTAEFDGVTRESLRISPDEISQAVARTPQALLQALTTAAERIRAYHAHEGGQASVFDDGLARVAHLDVPVDRAGCYAPGGRARYPSSVLMCAIPAQVAGVAEIVLCVPPNSQGSIDDVTLAAASIVGIDEVYAIGGAQAIAAMALGTESLRRVDVVVGPGNAFVAEAKRQLSGEVGVASAFAGPSEIVVIADSTTPPEFAAIDLLVQAEHGPDGMAWLITWDPGVAEAVEQAVTQMVADSPRRDDLLATMEKSGICVLVDGPRQAMEVSNIVAPEHLEILVEDYSELVGLVKAAGAVFCGLNAPASLGDYAVGPNHILPTNRSARFSSALRADDFRRHIHVVEVTSDGFATLGPLVEEIATAEGLTAHAESIRIRR